MSNYSWSGTWSSNTYYEVNTFVKHDNIAYVSTNGFQGSTTPPPLDMSNWNVFVIGYQVPVTPTPTPTISVTPNPTPTVTPTITQTPSHTPVGSPTNTPSVTETPTVTPTMTNTQTPTVTDLSAITTYTISGCSSSNVIVADLGPGAFFPGDTFYLDFTGATATECYTIINKINATPTDGGNPISYYPNCADCIDGTTTTYTISGCTNLNVLVADLGPGAFAPGDVFNMTFTGATPSGCYRVVNKIVASPTDSGTPLTFYLNCDACEASLVTPTPTNTVTPTNTLTPTVTETPTNTPTPTVTDTPTSTPTETPIPTSSETPTPTPTNTVTPTNTITPTITPTPTGTPIVIPTSGLSLYVDAGRTSSYSGSGNQWNDLSVNNNTGTLQNSPTYSSSNGGILTFNGSNQYTTFSSPSNIPIGNSNYTISVWFNTASLGINAFVGWGNYGTTNQVTALRLSATGFIHYWWGNDLSVNTALSINTWYNIVARFDGTNRQLWLNNVLIGGDTPGSSHNVPNANNLTIGVTNVNEYFNGKISNTLIYNRAISDSEIAELYNDFLYRFI